MQLENGEIFPAGLIFHIDFAAMMLNGEVFVNPHEFNPERFLSESPKGNYKALENKH